LHENEIPLNRLLESRYAIILTYPSADAEEARTRVQELSGLGISSLRFEGTTQIGGVPVLGKGCVGLVTQARLNGELVALKIRRSDADRPSMHPESRLLRLANSVDAGPRLIGVTKNFLAMELFRGIPLFRWAQESSANQTAVKKLVLRLLRCCFMLDSIDLDHGELSHAPKNVLVGKLGDPCIVDFESASMTRHIANVTSILQYFLFGNLSRTLHTSQIFPRKGRIVKALGEYKREGSVENFERVLDVLGLL
jgi:putative serine/threonine protein kinase